VRADCFCVGIAVGIDVGANVWIFCTFGQAWSNGVNGDWICHGGDGERTVCGKCGGVGDPLTSHGGLVQIGVNPKMTILGRYKVTRSSCSFPRKAGYDSDGNMYISTCVEFGLA
jgi:hypothetical protein